MRVRSWCELAYECAACRDFNPLETELVLQAWMMKEMLP